MKRILYLTADPGVPVLGHKGASVHVRGLVEALCMAGANVVVASPRTEFEGDRIETDVELVEISAVLPKAHEETGSLRRAMLEQTEEVVALARRSRVDAIYERLSLFSEAGVVAAETLGVPHLLEVNAPLRVEALRFRALPHARLARTLESRVLRATDKIFAVSRELAEVLLRAGLRPQKVGVLPNAVDPQRFTARHEPTPSRFTVGFCGSLKPWHGVDVLLDAFRVAAVTEPSLRLEVVGTGPEETLVRAAAEADERIVYYGVLAHRDALAATDKWHVGVAPFRPIRDFYFSPLKVYEYMAAGLCVIASELGQIRSLLAEDRGVLVEAGSVGALTDALLALADDPVRVAAFGAHARRYVLSEHTWERNASRILDVLTSLRPELAA